MTFGLLIDGLIVLILLAAVVGGWRQGAFSSVLSTVGIIAGLVLGAAGAPFVMGLTDQVALRLLFAFGVVILLVGLGNLVGGMIGASLRDRMRMRSSHTVDSLVGACFTVAATLIVLWLVSIPLATGSTGALGQGIRNSTILSFVDRHTPQSLAQLPQRISVMLDDSGFPPLFSPFDEPEAREVAAPKILVEDQALVESVRPSVIHVLGDAETCRRRLLGSGFVAEQNYVLTNAHVVAGTEKVRLDTVVGVRDAQVVYYNPEIDIALLYSPGLGLAPLPWAPEPAVSGEDVIVMGFPESGPFEAAPARVRDRLMIAGPDIYANGRVERESYTVRGSIRQGNSGGPMLNEQGEVLGVVFGASVDQTDTGYVVTAAQAQEVLGEITSWRIPVDTQECVAR